MAAPVMLIPEKDPETGRVVWVYEDQRQLMKTGNSACVTHEYELLEDLGLIEDGEPRDGIRVDQEYRVDAEAGTLEVTHEIDLPEQSDLKREAGQLGFEDVEAD